MQKRREITAVILTLLMGALTFVPATHQTPTLAFTMMITAFSSLLALLTGIIFYKERFWWAKTVSILVMLTSPVLVFMRVGNFDLNVASPIMLFSIVFGLLFKVLI